MHTTSAIPEAATARIQTMNGCKSYASNLRNSITNETLTDILWLDASQEASEEYDSQGACIQPPQFHHQQEAWHSWLDASQEVLKEYEGVHLPISGSMKAELTREGVQG